MYEKENAKFMARLKSLLEKKHGQGAVDLRDVRVLEHLFMYATAEFFDYNNYWETLLNLDESFDESLEHFDLNTWFGQEISGRKGDRFALECANAIKDAENSLRKLTECAEMQLTLFIKVVFTSPEETQMEILGQVARVTPRKIDRWLNEFFDEFFESDDYAYTYQIEKCFNKFIRAINKKLALSKGEQKGTKQ